MNTASINEHYTHDHNRLDELFHQFQTLKTSDRRQAAKLFSLVAPTLLGHVRRPWRLAGPAVSIIRSGPSATYAFPRSRSGSSG